jgi:hypothetical protein
VVTLTEIGRHRASRTDDLIRVAFAGSLKREDLEALRRVTAEMLAERPSCFLIADMAACTGIDASARKYMAEWSREGGEQLSGTAVYGVTFAMRAIVTLALSAIRFLGNQQVDVVFVKDEAEAVQWVAARRDALA